jgi:large subunit ribosomal protein L7/L12
MASEKVDQALELIESMTVLEASELVKAMEEKFGVTAAAPMMAMPAGGMPAGGGEAAAEEKTEFNVVLKEIGDQKIQVIKAVRSNTGLGLKEAKALVDNVANGPQPVKENLPKEDAEKVKGELEAAGAVVAIE